MKVGLIILLGLVCGSMALQARTWTNLKGQKIQAEIVKATESSVTLKRPNSSKLYTLELAKLIEADRKFVATWLADNAAQGKDESDTETKPNAPEGFIDNFDAKWPELISLERGFEIKEVSADTLEGSPSDSNYVYHSPHFEFVSEVKLSKSVVKSFAELFEATVQYLKVFPISSQKALKASPNKRRQILLYKNTESYVRAGAPSGSAGVYMGGRDLIMVNLENVGVKRVGNRYIMNRKKDNGTLSHEITHMFCDFYYYRPGARGWFSEGLAEYISLTPYRGGKYIVRGNRKAIQLGVTAYGKDKKGGRALGEKIEVGDLKTYMLQPYSSFTENSSLNYGVGALMTYYFFHMESGGDRKNINAFLKALRAGKKGQDAIDALLNGRTYEELAKDITKAWRPRGVRLIFE